VSSLTIKSFICVLLRGINIIFENWVPRRSNEQIKAWVPKSEFFTIFGLTETFVLVSYVLTTSFVHLQLKIYKVKSRQLSSKPLKFHLFDTPGLEEDQGIDSQELCYILDGNLPNRYMVNILFFQANAISINIIK
jgi:hypothetical protein